MRALPFALAAFVLALPAAADPPHHASSFLRCRDGAHTLSLDVDLDASSHPGDATPRLVLFGHLLGARVRIEIDGAHGDAAMGTSCEVYHVTSTDPPSATPGDALDSVAICHHRPQPGHRVRAEFVTLRNRSLAIVPHGTFRQCRVTHRSRVDAIMPGGP